jgi:acyl transferase domain-containing protein
MTRQHNSQSLEDVAIIGMSGRFPGARNLAVFWDNLRNGVESISFFSEQELANAGVDPVVAKHPDFINAGGILEDVELFDASFFGFSPREAETLDPQQRLLLESAWQALEDAAYDPGPYKGSIGVYAGGVLSSYLFNILSNREHREIVGDFQVFTGNDKDHLTTRISYKLNLKGPSITVQTACSTSLVAVAMACQSLVAYQCDMALAGGVAVRVPQKAGYIHQEGMIFSRDGHCRPFDAEASGTVFSNGVGVVVLKRLADAIADRDYIHAVIKGSAINNDGSLKVGYIAPSLDAQAEVIAMAQAVAEVDPRTITYVEAHGPATRLGDPIEVAALTKAFRAKKDDEKWCAIGSLKSNLGSLDAAAGVAGLIKTVLALKNKLIPPSINFRRPNPIIDFANGPFYVNTELSEWKSGSTPRRAGVSSFGMGGTNAHLVLEEAPALESTDSRRFRHLLLLSARSRPALEAATAGFAAYLTQHDDLNPADVAYTCQVGRRAFSHRRALVYGEVSDAARGLESLDEGRVLTATKSAGERSIVFMFPGQEAQHVNMGLGLYRTEPTFRKYVDDGSDLLKAHLKFDLRDTLYPPGGHEQEPIRRLEQTEVAQVALFVVEYALAQLWMEWGVRPLTMIGHSIGEYVAACLAGVFSFEDALFLVAQRGRLMQKLPRGSMLEVPLSEQELRPLLNSELDVAVINHPNSCVVSGPSESVQKLKTRLEKTSVECRAVHTSHAFHSRMMEPIREDFTALVATIPRHPPQIPYMSNVTGTWITAESATDPTYWATHLSRTVLFSQGVGCLLNASHRVLLEVGPGRTLSALAERNSAKTDDHVVLSSLGHFENRTSDADCLLNALGQLWMQGTEIDWRGFWRHESRYRVPLPTYPFERKRYWIDSQGHPEIPGHGPKPVSKKGGVTKKEGVADWFYVPCWKQTVPVQAWIGEENLDSKTCWLVFEDDCGVGSQTGDRLEQRGQTVVRVRRDGRFEQRSVNAFQIDPLQKTHYDRLFKELRDSGLLPRNILHCWSVTQNGDPLLALSPDDSELSAFYSLLFLSQALGDHCLENAISIGVVSNNLSDVTGAEQVRPEKAPILGLCRVIPQEYRTFSCRNVDIVLNDSGETIHPPALIDNLIAEVKSNSPEPIIAYRGNRRWIQTFEPATLPKHTETKLRFRENGVYLITGGLGGIGLTLAKYLAQTVHAKLVLVGRSQVPPHDDWAAIRDAGDHRSRKVRDLSAIEESGGEIMALAADVTDLIQMKDVIAKTYRRFGALHGVIHAAGIAGGGIIQLKTQESADRVFAPKVKGTLVLEAVLKNVRLDFLVLCSSVTSVLGGVGLADYAGANAFLDAFAQKRSSRDGTFVVSINWDTWQEVGMTVDLCGQHSGKQTSDPQQGIAPHQGLDAFSRILSGNFSQVAVMTPDLQNPVHTCQSATSARQETVTLQPVPDRERSRAAPTDDIERAIAEMWQKLLGIKQPGVYDNFFELGGDSLLGTRLLSWLRSSFRVQLPLQSLLEVPTVAGMAQRIRALR